MFQVPICRIITTFADMKEIQDINSLYNEVREIISTARQNAVRSVDFSRVQMYWQIGQRIQEEEQKGKERADYGSYLLKNLAKKLEPEYGSGFSVRQLERSRQFYKMYPIASALRSQFNWTQYRLLIAISDDYKREYYRRKSSRIRWYWNFSAWNERQNITKRIWNRH